MKIANSVAFVTGANRGLGLAFAKALLAGGARKVYAGARDPRSVKLPGVTPVRLDVTDPATIAEAAATCADVNLLINNAGIATGSALLGADAIEAARRELEVNYFGPLRMSRAFAPVLAGNGGGAIVNVLSALSWVSMPAWATYSASKSAAWSLTNGLRNELAAAQGTQVVALHVGYIDTDMTAGVDGTKSRPEDVVRAALEALEAGRDEALADEAARFVKKGLSAEPGVYLAAARG
ncbi:MAG TPA: SDR family oxidoreductase [Roseiarcus sp.]|jgi:NAD(P)-dependent dehydrogenase (short-subunit alcohol dehydrogenase family)